MVFITDIRRGNLHTQLMYKALFELSADRADFVVAAVHEEARPAGLTAKSTAREHHAGVLGHRRPSDEAVYKENLKAIKDHADQEARRCRSAKEDLDGIEYVYCNFYWFGPRITYNSSQRDGNGRRQHGELRAT